jgi:type II secretory pathway pseudopilin PulG
MKGGLKTVGSYGFTIIEIMIVLGVSGFILLGAITYVGGQQNNTEFYQSIDEAQLQIQSTINNVIDGYYPGLGNFTCTPSSNGLSINNNTQTQQGQNLGCIFLGKAIQFGMTGNDGNQNTDTYTIVGSQCSAGGNCSSIGSETYSGSLQQALPTILRTTSGAVDTTVSNTLEYGLYVSAMCVNVYPCGASASTGIVAFTQSLTGNDNDNIITGPQQIQLWTINGTSLNQTETQVIGNVDAAANWNTAVNSVYVCFSSATTSNSGLITIGYNNDQLGANLKIYNGATC